MAIPAFPFSRQFFNGYRPKDSDSFPSRAKEPMETVMRCKLPMANLQFCQRSPSPPLKPVAVPKPHVLLHPLAVSTFLKSSIRTPCSINRNLQVAASMASTTSSPPKPFSVLFVCLGNICRSPAAEGVFRGIVREKGMESKFMIDSAGTIDYHEGNPADSRMRAAAKKRAIEITSISRPIKPSDFIDFDLILAMDNQNRADILDAYSRWKDKASLPADAYKKVKLMCSYRKKHKETEVPDPYYGGPRGFEQVLDILEDACGSLFNSIVSENDHISSS